MSLYLNIFLIFFQDFRNSSLPVPSKLLSLYGTIDLSVVIVYNKKVPKKLNKMNENQTLEKSIPKVSGWITVIFGLAVLFYVGWTAYGHYESGPEKLFPPIKLILLLVLGLFISRSNTKIMPNRAEVYSFMGRYMGTLRGPGFFAVPFWWSLFSCRNLSIDTVAVKDTTVNDHAGNPIVIGCRIFCQEKDTYAATFAVNNLDDYLISKSKTAIRSLAMKYPMDSADDNVHTLRGNTDEVKATLMKEVTDDFQKAGYVVDSVAITSLHYSPEIAGLMLQRQQAKATIDARKTITDGAIGIVKDAVEKMSSEAGVKLSETNKQRLASNLLITLCSHQGVSPVMEVNA